MTKTIAELNDSLIGRYLVEKEIGQGGMATVYLARDVRHDRKVAIKVLHPELAAVLGPERFVTEMKVTANLQHPHILPLFDSGTARSQLFYVMPFVEGESLRDKLTREQQLPIDEALQITAQVAGALDYAHRHGVVHRDIKPENILLHDGTALVADFGIALAVSNAGGARLTQTGLSLGTPQYMSPEQATGDRNIDGRTDVYSLGCVLYEMLTGEPPFTGPSSQAIVARVLTESVRPIRARRDTVSQSVEDAVLKAVQKLPADRFATPGAFVEALRNGGRDERRETRNEKGRSSSLLSRLSFRIAIAAAVGIIAFMLGRRSAAAVGGGGGGYVGTLLGGPQVAMYPRASPDGKTLAFSGMVGRQGQLAVLNTVSGDWKMLTRDTTRGLVQAIAWSTDGTLIFYEREYEVPRGIYSISPLGDNDRLVLPNAGSPTPLPDGSLLAWRYAANGRLRMLHYSPDNGKLDSLPAYASEVQDDHLGALLAGGHEAVFIGSMSRDWARDTIFAINIETKKTRVLSVLDGPPAPRVFNTSPDGKSILLLASLGDDFRVVSIATDGSGLERTLFSTTSSILSIDGGPDGSIYVDQMNRPIELIRYKPGSAQPERTPAPSSWGVGVTPLPDGRVLALQRAGGPYRYVVAAPGKDPVEFLASSDSAVVPAASLGPDRIMMRTGTTAARRLTIAFAASGQIAGRIPGFDHDAFAGSPDGKTIFYADSGAIWAMPSAGGAARRIHDGTAVAVDPHGQYLVVQSIRDDGVHLVHVPLDGSVAHEIVHGSTPISIIALAPNAVAPDGRILVEVVSPASWFWPAAILDPKTGTLAIVPPGLGYDMISAGWDSDGRVVTVAAGLESTIWRFRPVTASARP